MPDRMSPKRVMVVGVIVLTVVFLSPIAYLAGQQAGLWLITPAIFLYNCIAAAFSRALTWRGTTYVLKSPHETVIISPSASNE